MLRRTTTRDGTSLGRRARAAGVLGAAGILVAGSLIAVSSRDVVASPTEFSGLSRSSTVNAPRDATWYGQINAKGLCALFAPCQSAVKTPSGYRLQVIGNVPGLGDVSQAVNVTIKEKVRPKLVRMRLSAKSERGSVGATIDLKLAKKADNKKTRVTVDVRKASGTGVFGTVMLPFLAQGLTKGLDTATASLNAQRKASGIVVKAKSKPKGKKRVVTVVLRQKKALVQPTPTAQGKVRITTTKGKVLCKAKIKNSRGKCGYRKGPKKPRVVATGVYASGFPVWHATTGKVAK